MTGREDTITDWQTLAFLRTLEDADLARPCSMRLRFLAILFGGRGASDIPDDDHRFALYLIVQPAQRLSGAA